MCLCLESYIGAEDRYEGVRLEPRRHVTESDFELPVTIPFEEDLLQCSRRKRAA